ncbi:hypothetical protein STRCI_000708 [Streptomyces cinnabarinus]|uniref:Uncharacterized protein n=1 Tax=Streptomyces cinnabarinus TaxID=67287 RepID=A0ABY7K776_9ACTN|nr:hypothetical protein [Streptomyces cinnabarinus]WAZ19645.1 hypothetical protein STRCI_000708 [Streptomyces cinnabarinus]
MTEIDRWRGDPASTAAPLRTPFQTPAVDRTPAGSAGRGGDTDGVTADWGWSDIPWHSIGKAARGALDAVL